MISFGSLPPAFQSLIQGSYYHGEVGMNNSLKCCCFNDCENLGWHKNFDFHFKLQCPQERVLWISRMKTQIKFYVWYSLLVSWKAGERGELKSYNSVDISRKKKEHAPDPFSQVMSWTRPDVSLQVSFSYLFTFSGLLTVRNDNNCTCCLPALSSSSPLSSSPLHCQRRTQKSDSHQIGI